MQKVDSLSQYVSKQRKSAWFQLVEYPVKTAGFMNHKFMYLQLAKEADNSLKKKEYYNLSMNAFRKIKEFTKVYNTGISNGKWNHIMSMSPRNLPVFGPPIINNKVQQTKRSVNKALVKPINIQANEFIEKRDDEKYKWKVVEGLGYSNSSITLFPFTSKKFENNQPYVSYSFNIEKVGLYELEIRVLPTHSNNFDHEITVEIDSNSKKKFSINTKGRSKTWKENVLRNSAIVKHSFQIDKVGKHNIKILVNQTGIVIDQLSIQPEGQPNRYEIPN